MKFATLSTLLLSALSIDIAFGWNYGSEETYSGTITVTNLAPMGGTCQTVSHKSRHRLLHPWTTVNCQLPLFLTSSFV